VANESGAAGAGRTSAAPGYYVVGEFLSAHQGDAYEDRAGHTRVPLVVKVLVGDESVNIRFNDASKAEQLVNGAKRGEIVTLRIFPRLVKPASGDAFVKIEGWVPRGAPAA